MRKYNYYIQDDPSSCGVYCVAMVLSYHGRNENILKLKQAINPHFAGSSVSGMIRLLKGYNIEAKGYQSDLDSFLDEASFPAIAMVDNHGNNHYVVVYKKTKKNLLVGDPQKGKIKLAREQFASMFKGIVINIEHVGRYESKNKSNSLVALLAGNLKEDRFGVGRLIGFSLLISLATLAVSWYYNNIFQEEIAGNLLLVVSVAFAGLIVIKALLEKARSFLFFKLQRGIMERLVCRTVENIVYLQPFFFQNLKQGKTLTQINNLFVLSATICTGYTTITFDLVLVVFLFGTIALISWQVFAAIIIAMVLFAWGLFRLLEVLKKVEGDYLENEETFNETVLELINNYHSINQYSMRSFFKKKVGFHYDAFAWDFQEKNMIQVKISLLGDLIVSLMGVLIIILATLLPFDKSYLILIYLLFTLGARFLMNIVTFAINFPEMALIFAKYQLLLPDKPENRRRLKKTIRSIECCNLKFGYGRNLIFDNFNRKITGNTIITGAIGKGKTTLSLLLCGDLEAQSGEILINGDNLGEYDSRHLKRKIVYLDKQPTFFNESLRFNILLGGDQEKLMIELLEKFNQSALLDLLECQLDQDFLSAGMAQIVMIVRTICQGAEVIILDEALSNIDLPTAQVIIDYLEKLDIIVLMITHNTKLMNLCVLYDRIDLI